MDSGIHRIEKHPSLQDQRRPHDRFFLPLPNLHLSDLLVLRRARLEHGILQQVRGLSRARSGAHAHFYHRLKLLIPIPFHKNRLSFWAPKPV